MLYPFVIKYILYITDVLLLIKSILYRIHFIKARAIQKLMEHLL
ncbi:MAG: hypothetical protein JWQ79_2120 [Mucilaginibacter sp.]|jgi:hypothetical protein|nr:hypothetical protein [Mucilaginibacter sp.]